MINHERICYRVLRDTYRLRGGYQPFETIGCYTCKFAGTRRRRRLWRIVGSDNGIAYYRNRDGWFIPVGRVEEFV